MYKILRVGRRVFSAAALVGLTAFAGMAQAVVFIVDWDPIFNPAFSTAVGQSVGWKGTGSVTVSADCLIPAPGTSSVGMGCSSATLNGATLIFYNTGTLATIGSIAWTGSLPAVDEVSVDAFGIVDGINLSGTLTATTGGIFGPSYDVELNFFTPFPTTPSPWFPTYEGPALQLSRVICDGDSCFTDTYRSATGVEGEDPRNVPTSVWRVPEPGSLALFAVALTALGLSRRRKS